MEQWLQQWTPEEFRALALTVGIPGLVALGVTIALISFARSAKWAEAFKARWERRK